VKFKGGPLVVAVLAGLALLLSAVMFTATAVGAGAFLLLCALPGGGYAYYSYQALPTRREAIRLDGERIKTQGRDSLQGAIAEAADLRQEWQLEIAKAVTLIDYLSRLGELALLAKPADLRRGVSL
jgi:hypothetical protein